MDPKKQAALKKAAEDLAAKKRLQQSQQQPEPKEPTQKTELSSASTSNAEPPTKTKSKKPAAQMPPADELQKLKILVKPERIARSAIVWSNLACHLLGRSPLSKDQEKDLSEDLAAWAEQDLEGFLDPKWIARINVLSTVGAIVFDKATEQPHSVHHGAKGIGEVDSRKPLDVAALKIVHSGSDGGVSKRSDLQEGGGPDRVSESGA